MTRSTILTITLLGLTGLCLDATVVAQDQPEVATRPAPGVESLYFEVSEVRRNVRASPAGLDPKKTEGWTPLKPGDRITAGTQIYVPLRGKLKLTARPADPPTVVLIESLSLVNFSELLLEPDVARSRIKLAYGAVRAGVAEGRVRSDMEIESPVATLSKRGTDLFRFSYHDGKFRMSLTPQGRGMIQAIQHAALGRRQRIRSITPGQWITQRMLMAVDNIQFDRGFVVNDAFGLSGADQWFAMLNTRGIGFLLPTGSNVINFLDAPTPGGMLGVQPGFDPDRQRLEERLRRRRLQGVHNIPAGSFGIGQGPLPYVADTPLNRDQASR